MRTILVLLFAIAALPSCPAFAGDEILDAIDRARSAYQSNNSTDAKRELDIASQLIAQKSAERFTTLFPEPLSGWKADKAEVEAGGIMALAGGSRATRAYHDAKGAKVEVQIAGDSGLVAPFAAMLNNPQLATLAGKLVRIGDSMAIQSSDGDLNLVVANKYLISVTGSAPADAKLAYAQAIDISKLAKL